MANDGSLIFSTKIDTDGFEKGSEKLSSKIVKIKNDIINTEAEISKLTQELEEMANTPVDSGLTKGLERNIEKAKIKLRELYAQADSIGNAKQADLAEMGLGTENLDEILGRDDNWNKVQSQIDNTEAKLRQYEAELQKVRNAEANTSGKDTAEYKKKQQRIDELNRKLELYQVQLRETQQKEKQASKQTLDTNAIQKRLSKALNATADRLGKTKKAFVSFAKKGVEKATNGIKRLTSHTRKSNSQMSGLGRTLTQLKGMLLSMVFFNLISTVMDSMTKSMGQMSKESDDVNSKLSSLKTYLTHFKHTIATAFMPIVNVAVPVLTKLMDSLSAVTNKVANFIAVLSGQNSYQKAVKVQQDYADSLEDTASSAEKATNNLASFDELNVMQDNTSTVNSSEETANYFETVPTVFDNFADKLKKAFKKGDFKAIGKLVANKFNKALKNISWDKIRSTCKSWANNTVSFLNGFIEKADWGTVGTTFGNAINTIIDVGYEAVVNFDWKKFGSGIREAIANAVKTIDFNKAIDFLTGALNGIVDSAISFVGTPDFSLLGQRVYDGLARILKKINWGNISTLFTNLVIGALDFIDGFTININWETLGEKIETSFTKFFDPDGNGGKIIKRMKKTLTKLMGGLLTTLDEIFEPADWEKYGKDFAEGVKNFDTDEDAIQNRIIKTIGNILNSAMNFVNAYFSDQGTADKLAEGIEALLRNVPWETIFISSLSGLLNIATWIVDLAVTLVDDFCEGLASGFTTADDDGMVTKAVGNLFIDIGNCIITIVEDCIKLLVNSIPNFFVGLVKVILELLAGLMIPILGMDWFNSATQGLWGKDSFYFDFPVNIPRIPRLATGTVVPASYGEFLAVLGDNKRETEVVSPLSTIKQALVEAIAEVGGFGGSEEINLNVYLDGDKIFKSVVNRNNRYKKSHGKSAMK